MNEWTELKTLQDVAAAQARGEEIECRDGIYNEANSPWCQWEGALWKCSWLFRSRPKKKPKTVLLRKALMHMPTQWPEVTKVIEVEIGWLDTPTREIEVEE